jgi:thymidylate synthase
LNGFLKVVMTLLAGCDDDAENGVDALIFTLSSSTSCFVLQAVPVRCSSVVEELLCFMRGVTNAARLRAQGVHIWDGNLDSIVLHEREEDDLGPVSVNFGWTHSGKSFHAACKQFSSSCFSSSYF